MREIKFRAWDGERKKMLHFSKLTLCREYNHIAFQVVEKEEKDSYGCVSLGDPESEDEALKNLMQFTGLKDKNGKEIYEGDIVHSDHWDPKRYEVVFDRGCYCMKFGNDSNFYPDAKYCENMEVIGNIYENKDLLS